MYEYRLASLTFENGFAFRPGKLTVVVGPNNSGKSRLLRDVRQLCTSQTPDTVVAKRVTYTRPPTPSALEEAYRIEPHFDPSTNQVYLRTLDADMTALAQTPVYGGSPAGWKAAYDQLVQGLLDGWDQHGAAVFAQYFGNYFVTRLTTESRLLVTKEGSSGDPRSGAQTLLQAFYNAETGAEEELSALVNRAYGLHVKLDYSNLSTLCLRVGNDFADVSSDPRLARRMLESFHKLEEQGDGMRSFVATVLSLLVGAKPVLLLDEPEAFLHPPQAAELGAIIAEQSTARRQTIVATHSVDLLRGILSRTSDVDLIRLSRGPGGMQINNLGPDEVRQIANNPLLNSTRVLDGLFYKGVVVVEADSDSAFYQRVARTKLPGDEIHYTHAHNKQTLHKVVGPYKKMGVRVVAVPDFDVLRDQSEFETLLKAATDDETTGVLDAQERIRQEVENAPVSEQLEQLREQLNQLANERSVGAGETEAKALNDLKRHIRAAVKDANLWTHYKHDGRAALSEKGVQAFDLVDEFCRARGVFIVPVGELESWMVPHGLERMSKNHWIVQALQLLSEIDLPEKSDLAGFVTGMHDYLLQVKVVGPASSQATSADDLSPAV